MIAEHEVRAGRRCEVCGIDDPVLRYEVDGYQIVRCRGCGLMYVGSAPDKEALAKLYDKHYYEDATRPGYEGYKAAEARKRHHSRGLLDLLERVSRPGALLEVGCAYGYFLDEARSRGWRARGVEPSDHARRHAVENLELEVAAHDFTSLPVEHASLDAVVLWDVIEHLPNPRATISRAWDWLRPGGIIALSTGNVSSLAARIHGPDWSLLTPPWHQFYFSRKTLKRLLESCGFEVILTRGDGAVAVDRQSRRPRLRGRLASVLERPLITRGAARFGAGTIVFLFARKTPSRPSTERR